MADATRADLLSRLFGPGTGGRYDFIVDQTTGGKDRLWKEELLSRLEAPRRVLDLACGTGILTFGLRDRFPEATVVGVEINDEYLRIARARASERRDERVHFVLGAAEEAPLEGSFDAVVSCYLPKYADLDRLVPRLTDRLEPGGRLLMHDFVYPADPVVARAWAWGFRRQVEWARANVPAAVGMFEGLPEVIRTTRWVEDLTALLREHGMTQVSRDLFDNGQVAIVSGVKATPVAADR